jgi:hypothetical protein
VVGVEREKRKRKWKRMGLRVREEREERPPLSVFYLPRLVPKQPQQE